MKKRCSKCGKVKPVEAFAKFAKGKDGRRAQCKECDKRYRNKRKRLAMPKEDDPYVINKSTVTNHFYLHFGFTDRRYNYSEGYQLAKYSKSFIIIKNKEK